MSNMSYCRFQNTLADLEDCSDNLYNELSPDEARARIALIKVAYEIVSDFLKEDGRLNLETIRDLPQETEE